MTARIIASPDGSSFAVIGREYSAVAKRSRDVLLAQFDSVISAAAFAKSMRYIETVRR